MYDTARETIEALSATPDVLARLLRGVTQPQAQAARGGDENWSVVQVVCHLRDAEEIAYGRMCVLRDAAEPLIAGFDQEALARERDYASADLQAALAEFSAQRSAHVAALRELTPAQWERVGQHRANGPVSILNHSLHATWHDAVHLAQIARQLALAE
jgi:hypothetical protein